MFEKEFIAHTSEINDKIQTVREHSINTAEKAERYAIDEFKELAYLTGIYHDIGKYRSDFQKLIKGISNKRVEHAIYGALAVKEDYNNKINDALNKIMEVCIAGHHGGLPDYGSKSDIEGSSLYARMHKPIDEECKIYLNELKDEIESIDFETITKYYNEYLKEDCLKGDQYTNRLLIGKYAFLGRYIYSCLTDADYNDTAEFCAGQENKELKADFRDCLDKINVKFASFTPKTKLQKARSVMQKQVFNQVNDDAEIYCLPMPTGSGKTLCSMKFALERAIIKKKRRIIYVIPYNSIIDQTASEFDNIFGKSNFILRHQSTFSYEDANNFTEDYRNDIKFSTENWNADIIITTQVQFFESIYGNKKSKLRRLHNIADSVLVFDEAHMIPEEFMQPCLESIAILTHYFHCEAILLTATMPGYADLFENYAIRGLKVKNLISNEDSEILDCITTFKKCRYKNAGKLTDDILLDECSKYPSTLIILNRKKDAQRLYNMAKGRYKAYHLSTYMTAYDRRRVIAKVRSELAELNDIKENEIDIVDTERIVVISTSLIEAGVDLDFYTVYREQGASAGLEDLLQSGGRCNREGTREDSVTYAFELIENADKPLQGEKPVLTKMILEKYGEGVDSAEAIKDYYDNLYSIHNKRLEAKNICSLFPQETKVLSIPFKSYADSFKLIDGNTVSIVIPDEQNAELQELIEKLRNGYPDVRKLQIYSCSVNRSEFDDLLKQNVVKDYGTGVFCLTNASYYSKESGIKFDAEDYFL